MKLQTIIDAAKARTDTGTGYAAAKALKIKHNTFYQYESGIRVPDVTVCIRLAELTGLPLGQIVKAAETAKKQNWKRYARNLVEVTTAKKQAGQIVPALILALAVAAGAVTATLAHSMLPIYTLYEVMDIPNRSF